MEKNNVIVKTKGILTDIKFKLAIKQISSKTISANELKDIVENAKKDADVEVKARIDDVFDEYFNKNTLENTSLSASTLSLDDMEKMYADSVSVEKKPAVLSLNLNGTDNKAA